MTYKEQPQRKGKGSYSNFQRREKVFFFLTVCHTCCKIFCCALLSFVPQGRGTNGVRFFLNFDQGALKDSVCLCFHSVNRELVKVLASKLFICNQ